MATNYLHPGLYIEELPGPHTIQGAPTSVAAFVGMTESSSTVTAPYNEPILVTSWNDYQSSFGSLAWGAALPWAVFEFLTEGGTACYVVRVDDSKRLSTQPTISAGVTLAPASNWEWSKTIGVIVQNPVDSHQQAITSVVNLYVVSLVKPDDLTLAGRLLGGYIAHNSLQFIQYGKPAVTYAVLESFTGLTSAKMLADQVNAGSIFIRAAAPGEKAVLPTDTGQVLIFKPLASKKPDFSAAYKQLKKIQGISLIAMPDTATLVDSKGLSDWATQQAEINGLLLFCEQQQNLFCAADPPFGLTVQNMVSFKTGQTPTDLTGVGGVTTSLAPVNSVYAGIYHPWVYVLNPATGNGVPIPPSGPALGRYGATDNNVGVWKAPAGTTDGLMQSVMAIDNTEVITNDLQDFLNPLGINAIRNMINYGNLIYGARTTSMGGDWTYLSIRRLFIYVEQSLRNSMQWVVFEPNDQRLWAKVTRDIGAFLTTLWRQGGLFGATAAQAFFVVCDSSNNPPELQRLGQLTIDVGLSPVYPAEFVVIRISQKTASAGS